MSVPPLPSNHGTEPPSAWVTRWAHLIQPGGHVLDVACGAGRHAHWLAARGLRVTAVDCNANALALVAQGWPPQATHPPHLLHADLEHQPWPLGQQTFDAVLLTNYLWRPLWPHLLAALAPGGVYLHETFAHGNATVGKPARPDFLLQPGELLQACQGLRVVAFEDGFAPHPARYVQRIAAVRETAPHNDVPPRHPLTA